MVDPGFKLAQLLDAEKHATVCPPLVFPFDISKKTLAEPDLISEMSFFCKIHEIGMLTLPSN